MTIIQPITAAGIGTVVLRPLPDVQPFSIQSGYSFEGILSDMRTWLRDVLVPYLEDNSAQAIFQQNVDTMIDAVNTALTAQALTVSSALNQAVSEVINGAVPVENALVLAVLTAGTSTVRSWLDARYAQLDQRGPLDTLYVSDRADELQGAPLYVNGDSFTQPIGGQTPAAAQLTADKSMVLNNQGVSSSFWRDTAVRMINHRPNVAENGLIVLQSGINMVVRHQTEALFRKTEYYAMQAALLLACASTSLESDSSGNATGTWDSYAHNALSNGIARKSTVPGSKFSWTPSFGYWFGIGFTFPSSAGAVGDTGKWSAASTVEFAGGSQAPGPTALEQTADPNGAQQLVPWAVKLPVLSGSQPITVEVMNTTGAYTIVDALYKVRDDAPTIAVVLPVRIKQGTYSITEQDLQVIRGDHRRAVAELVNAYPSLAGRIVLVDPHRFGWDPNVHTIADGLHPNTAGHRVIATAIEKTVGRLNVVAPLMASWGSPGVGTSYPLDWLPL